MMHALCGFQFQAFGYGECEGFRFYPDRQRLDIEFRTYVCNKEIKNINSRLKRTGDGFVFCYSRSRRRRIHRQRQRGWWWCWPLQEGAGNGKIHLCLLFSSLSSHRLARIIWMRASCPCLRRLIFVHFFCVAFVDISEVEWLKRKRLSEIWIKQTDFVERYVKLPRPQIVFFLLRAAVRRQWLDFVQSYKVVRKAGFAWSALTRIFGENVFGGAWFSLALCVAQQKGIFHLRNLRPV